MADLNLAPSSPLNILRNAATPISGKPFIASPEQWEISQRTYCDSAVVSFGKYGNVTYTVSSKETETAARVIISCSVEHLQAAIVDFCENVSRPYGSESDLNESDAFLDAVVAATLKAREANQTRRAKLAAEAAEAAA